MLRSVKRKKKNLKRPNVKSCKSQGKIFFFFDKIRINTQKKSSQIIQSRQNIRRNQKNFKTFYTKARFKLFVIAAIEYNLMIIVKFFSNII